MENLERLTITIPVVEFKNLEPLEHSGLAWRVSPTLSHVSIRNVIHGFAKCFREEFQYDFVQFSPLEGNEHDDRCHPWIWIKKLHPDHFVIIGACCFRNRDEQWIFDWAWFHPYYRNHGLLSTAWAGFEQKYGKNFIVEPPVSPSMKSFLKNRNYLEHTAEL